MIEIVTDELLAEHGINMFGEYEYGNIDQGLIERSRAVVPPEKWESFNEWAVQTGYYLTKPPYMGLRDGNGSEWSAWWVLGKFYYRVLSLGAQLCWKTLDGKVHTATVVK